MLDVVEVARLAEGRLARGTAEVADEYIEVADGVACWSGPKAWSSLAAGIGLAGPVSDADLDRLVAFYDERGGAARIEVAPFVPESLIAGLGARGFRLRRFENVLARELAADDDLRGLLTHGWPSGLEVRPPHADEVEAFVIASEAGFLEPGQRIDPADLEVGVRMVSHPRVHSFCAVVDGEIVGASSMEVDGEIAGLFGTSVYEAYRRRGIQQAVLVARLERARALGARIATIDSLPGIPTERNARRLGFEGAYTKVMLVRPRAG